MSRLIMIISLCFLMGLNLNAKRIALVVGVGNYPKGQGPLGEIPNNDAKDITAQLKKCNYEVILRIDANFAQTVAAIQEFKKKLSPGDEALFYYSGHGIRINNRNCIVPIDSKAIAIDDVLQIMEQAKTAVNVVIVDACRNDLKRSQGEKPSGTFGEVKAPTGSYIAFSTNPGNVALNTVNGKNSEL